MKFIDVARGFEAIEKVSSRLEITELLAHLLKQATPSQASIICYLSLGELNPPYIGTQFQLAEKSLIKVVAMLLHQSLEDATKEAKKIGDIGSLVDNSTWRTDHGLSVQDVYRALEHIEKIGGTGSQEEKNNALHDLLKHLDPLSAKYVIRIINGKLRLGFSDMTILDALSWMDAGNKSLRKILEDAYNVSVDIGLIAKTLKEGGAQAIQSMNITVGIPIRPAAAERLPTAKDIVEKLGTCIAQPKLDGFRLQIHLNKTKTKKPEVHFFSRNLIDMSAMFPDITKTLVDLDVEEVIFEGEAIVYDPNTGGFLPFQETVKRKRKHGIEEAIEELPLFIFIFDLLYINGKSMLNHTHEERRAMLKKLFADFPHDNIKVIEERVMHNAKELEDYFLANITAGLEGLVVKRPDAIYQPGKRNFNWIKLKRQEEGHLEDTLDCVVFGYYAGKGKRAGFGIGAFLVGVYNPQEDIFQTVAKIGTGLTDDEWKELKKKADGLLVHKRPVNIDCAKELYPDVWVNPEIVCQIRADEITISPLHTAGKTEHKLGYALRFPRFMGYRPDKSAQEATTIHEIKRLYDDQYQ